MRIVLSDNGWGALTPRRWQGEALTEFLKHFGPLNKSDHPHFNKPKRALIRAVCGAGKGAFIAQCIACIADLKPDEVVVVTAPTIFLVQQLRASIQARVGPVGVFYTEEKNLNHSIIVACTASLLPVAQHLRSQKKVCVLWVPDEAHGTETNALKSAYAYLQPQHTCGFTATAFRSSDEERLTLFEHLLYDYGPRKALADKNVVVPYRPVPWEGSGETSIDDACIQMTAQAIGPGLYNARSIADAIQFASKLSKSGRATEAIHSGLPDVRQKELIEQLRTGKLKSLVHVNILAVGVDLPWLRWLCMRRPVQARVRFVQEVGRILRYYIDPITGEEKLVAILYDPHGLIDLFAISYEETLGGECVSGSDDGGNRHLNQAAFEVATARSFAPLISYLSELVCAFDLTGLIDRRVASRAWRANPSTDKQTSVIESLVKFSTGRFVPRQHRKAIALLAESANSLNRGCASDLTMILSALSEKRTWPDLNSLETSADEAMERREILLSKRRPATPQS